MKKITIFIALFFVLASGDVFSQQPYRVGTTSANFLEIGYGSIANAMGDAHVAIDNGDLSSLYWNPASLGYRGKNEAFINVQPWVAGINTSSAGFGYVHPSLGTFAASVIMMDYGSEDVTTVSNPNGTGEKYDGMDFCLSLSYGRKIVDWFSFGFTAKYISTQIWHETASAVAFDLGAIVNTKFFAWTDKPGDGLNIGMSISNYGTKLTYDGMDLKQSVDIEPDENGNYANVPVTYEVDSWELPLIFRLGVSFYPYKSEMHSFQVAVDALHPNNNSESINVGCQYNLNIPTYGEVFLRGGYKGLFMNESSYGLSFGMGVILKMFGNQSVKFDYAYRTHEVFGNINSFSVGFIF
jgi:hypothetical protein